MMFRCIITGFLLLVLAGCMLGPDFVSPSASTDANETFRIPDKHPKSADAVSLAEHEWRQVYQDEQLQLLIEQGLRNNFDLQTARIRLEQAHAERTRARAPLFPAIELERLAVITSRGSKKR